MGSCFQMAPRANGFTFRVKALGLFPSPGDAVLPRKCHMSARRDLPSRLNAQKVSQLSPPMRELHLLQRDTV